MLASPKRGLGRKLLDVTVEEVTAGTVPGGKKCKKVGRLGLNLAMRLLQHTPQTQVPGLHKEKHYLVDILTVYFDICVAKKQVLQPTSLHEEILFRLPWKHKST